ncbi:uncharacterized protein LOC134690192 [Mytilus trossulus]|uniref:uncharacterized protein LOC134690192 n=1 Tax=Mytilus trossulus TaxID=6551 RepID=UPI0030065E83
MTDNPDICSICDRRHITTSSSVWCYECEQSLFSECQDVHTYSRSSESHDTIPISSYISLKPSVTVVSTYCTEHNERFQLFCQTHDELICLTCLKRHSECKDMVTLKEMIKDIKTSESFRETIRGTEDAEHNFEQIDCVLQENLESLREQKKTVLQNIANIRIEVNKRLDDMQQTLTKEFSNSIEQESSKIKVKMKKVEENKLRVKEARTVLEQLIKNASDLQTFYSMRQITSDIINMESYMQSIVEDDSLDKLKFDFTVDEKINMRSILRIDPTPVPAFGCIQVLKSRSKISLVRHKDIQAQLVGKPSNASANDKKFLKVKQICDFEIDGKFLSGCCMLKGGKWVFSSYEKDKVIITDSCGNFLFRVCMKPAEISDVAYIDDSNVAVSSCSKNNPQICLVDITERKTTSYIPLSGRCFGISYRSGSLFVCVEGLGIQKVNLEYRNVETVVKCKLPPWSYVALTDNHLYYTNTTLHTVTCSSMVGKIVWEYQNEMLKEPRGLALDDRGYIYIAGNTSSNVILLCSNGQKCQQLLSKDNGIRNPRALYYDIPHNQLFVATKEGKVHIFEVSE